MENKISLSEAREIIDAFKIKHNSEYSRVAKRCRSAKKNGEEYLVLSSEEFDSLRENVTYFSCLYNDKRLVEKGIRHFLVDGFPVTCVE